MSERAILLPKEALAGARAVRVQRIATFLAGLSEGRAWEVVVRPFKRNRTNQQSRYERGVACKLLAETMGYEIDEVHEYLCGTYFGWKQERCPKTPNNPLGIKDVPIRTTTRDEDGKRDVLDKQKFSDFVAFVQRFGAKHGVYIPDPDPEYYLHVVEAA